MIASGSASYPSAALSHQTANLFSDLLVHHMGEGLADGITQGAAGPDEFRTAPLWGVGQRVLFLHDGRTSHRVDAIRAHESHGSEANKVIEHFNRLTVQEQQEIIDFSALTLAGCGRHIGKLCFSRAQAQHRVKKILGCRLTEINNFN